MGLALHAPAVSGAVYVYAIDLANDGKLEEAYESAEELRRLGLTAAADRLADELDNYYDWEA